MKTVTAPAVNYEFRSALGGAWEKRTLMCATFAEANRHVDELNARPPHHFRNARLTCVCVTKPEGKSNANNSR